MTPILLLAIAAFLCIVILLFRPLPIGDLVARPDPAGDYAEAERRIDALRVREEARIISDARVRFFTHGKQADRALVLVHGYTNCPRQFEKLGEWLFRRGFNVLIANLPRHGLPDRMNDEQAGLTAEELVDYGNAMADIAQGLGRQVVFAGISCGGVVSAWAWAFREDVHKAILLAPAFGFRMIPAWFTLPLIRIFKILPNIYNWWNPVEKIQGTPEHTYPRYALRALREILRLAFVVRRKVEKKPPAGKELVVVTNPCDWGVDNPLIERVLRGWRKLGIPVVHHQFDASWKLDHDFIEPAQPNQPIEITYPLLAEWIAGKE